MKKYWYLVVILVIIAAVIAVVILSRKKKNNVTPSNTNISDNANMDTSTTNQLFSNKIILNKGDSGEQVKILQKYLNIIYGCKLIEDGVWGDKTQIERFEPEWKNGITSSQYNAIWLEMRDY